MAGGRCILAAAKQPRGDSDVAKLLKSGEHVLGVDVGGTKVMALVLDRDFKAVGRAKKKMRTAKNDDPAEARVIQAMREALDNAGLKEVRGAGVGSPGPLDPETGVIIDTPNLAWKNFPLAQTLSDTFGVPVAVDNDVNMGTYGEWRFGDVSDCKNVVGVFPGTGIGGGLILNGQLYRGATGAAGEVGHMTVEVDGPYCGCGKRGCLEALASRIAIASQVAALAAREDAPYILAQCGADLTKMRSSTLAKAIENGDKMVEDVVRRAAYYVGIGVSNLINILSPEAVVLGGGLVESMEGLFLEEAKRAMKAHCMRFLRKAVRLVRAKLGDDAVAMGGGMLIAERLSEAS